MSELLLREIIDGLNAGESPDTVRAKLKTLVGQTDSCTLMAMEQKLIAGGMPVEKLQGLCDLHSQVTRDVLVQLPAAPLPPGHPADTFRRENQALREVVARVRAAASPDERRQAVNELMDIEKHYQRKEHLLFTCLERHGINGPSKVMWAKDDEVRARLKGLRANPDSNAEPALSAVEEMIYKEENILLPAAMQKLTETDWAEIWASSPRYGWCLVEPREGYRPAGVAASATTEGAVHLPTGSLTLAQLTALFSTLPVDITFVDADDRVAFFSEGPDRVFARSKAVIGRQVQNCHPPRSVDVVNRILDDFRAGRQNVAEFWIDFMDRFVHIRYFALRDEEKRYLGCLEVTQDATAIRKLEGQRRLLQYE
ncbi:MAG: DUF438 domain-containing protein [Acidobacteria bacterium]|nr:DUF438 domain-containing protein [Acidobacteriota bacterium]